MNVTAEPVISLQEVSKWYGEILGLSRVSLALPRGITSLVGPNGSGKSTLMNLVTGLLRPSKGSISVLGVPPSEPQALHRLVGYCTQHDTFHAGFTGQEFLTALLRTHGLSPARARERAVAALERVGLADAGRRKIGAYSKGMRQRLKLALATAHEPAVLILDEPLNGLDPLGRSQAMGLFAELAAQGASILLSSHVLHEVDVLSSGVVMLHHGHVVADGAIREVRQEIRDKPLQVQVVCASPRRLAARALAEDTTVSARVGERSVLVETFDSLAFARLVTIMAAEEGLEVEGMDLADENVQAVYDYLIGTGETAS